MKKFIFFAFIAITFFSCGIQPKMSDINSTPEEKWEVMQDYMAPGANASDKRPSSDILSEQEVLLKAADYAYTIGALHPSYYLYEDDPALLTAKIETPILIHNFTGYDDGDGAMYLLTAVNDSGECLMGEYVRPVINADGDSFEITRFFRGSNSPESSSHIISKREAKTLINSQFSAKTVSEPIAVRMKLDGDKFSHLATFWYFTVEDNNQRSAAGAEKEEYIIDADIWRYKTIPSGVANRSAISTNGGGSVHLGGARMAKLETPMHFLDKLQDARSNARSLASVAAEPVTPARITPVPLK